MITRSFRLRVAALLYVGGLATAGLSACHTEDPATVPPVGTVGEVPEATVTTLRLWGREAGTAPATDSLERDSAIQRSWPARSLALCHLSSGFFARHFPRRCSSERGVSGWCVETGAGSVLRIAAISEARLAP